MHTEYLVIDDGSHGEAVEAVGEYLPQPDIEPPLALIIEPINPIYLRVLVVTSEEENLVGVADLEGEKQAYRLQALFPTINVVPEEEVAGRGWIASVLEQSEQVLVLSVDIT